mgnify:CR=1 FL=1
MIDVTDVIDIAVLAVLAILSALAVLIYFVAEIFAPAAYILLNKKRREGSVPLGIDPPKMSDFFTSLQRFVLVRLSYIVDIRPVSARPQ